MKLSKLFHLCAYDLVYRQAGDSVNYQFVEDGKHLYIFFEGSNSITDWVRNFLFTKKVYKMFRAHRGFLAAYQEVRNIILDKVYEKKIQYISSADKRTRKETYKFDEITIVGYSHGAALTQLALEDIVYHRPDIEEEIKGYAFEAPRALKVKKQYRELWHNLTVIRCNNDIVTHCPPKIFGYTDLGTMLKINGDISLVDGKLPKCIKSHYPQVVYNGLIKEET